MKVLVTGASGFAGSHVPKHVAYQDHGQAGLGSSLSRQSVGEVCVGTFVSMRLPR